MHFLVCTVGSGRIVRFASLASVFVPWLLVVSFLVLPPAWADSQVFENPQVLTADESRHNDFFGFAIDVDGNTAVASMLDELSPDIYVYEIDGLQWMKSATIRPGFEEFEAFAVALDGDTLLMGMQSYDHPDICSPAQPNCNNGMVLVYEREAAGSGEWEFKQALLGYEIPDAGFGRRLAIDGDVLVVSAYKEAVDNSPTSDGMRPQASPEAIDNAGAVYVYERDTGGTGQWELVQRIKSETPLVDAFFGSYPRLTGDTLMINDNASGGYSTGVVVYRREPGDAGKWTRTQRIGWPSLPVDSLDFDGNTLVHSYFDAVNFVSNFEFFERDESGQFVLVQTLVKQRLGWFTSGRVALDHGQMVELHSDSDLVGRLIEKSPETGLWEETGELRFEGFNAQDGGAHHLALDGGRLLIGTWRDGLRGEVLAYEVAPAINAGHMGGWFNPNTVGQGVLIDVDEANDFLFGAWFTYTLESSNNAQEQQWFTAQGNYAGNKAELTLFESLGGQFDASAEVETLPVGVVTFSFTDCSSGMLNYRIDTLGVRGSIPLVRLLPGSEAICETRHEVPIQSIDINQGMNGAWYNDQTSGQGFLIDTLPDGAGGGFIFVAWFTFGETAASGQRWLTAQGNLAGPTADIVVYESTGGNFDSPLLPSTDPVGSMQVDFTDCDTATLSYELDEGRSGTIPLARLLPTANALCKEIKGED